MPDHYEVLGVSRDASSDEIKQAWRAAAQIYHPDRHQGGTARVRSEAERRFKEAAEANEVLSDPAKRANYDAAALQYRTSAPTKDESRLWVEPTEVRFAFDTGKPTVLKVVSRLFLEGLPLERHSQPELECDDPDFVISSLAAQPYSAARMYPVELTLRAQVPRRSGRFVLRYLVGSLTTSQVVEVRSGIAQPSPAPHEAESRAANGHTNWVGVAFGFWLAATIVLPWGSSGSDTGLQSDRALLVGAIGACTAILHAEGWPDRGRLIGNISVLMGALAVGLVLGVMWDVSPGVCTESIQLECLQDAGYMFWRLDSGEDIGFGLWLAGLVAPLLLLQGVRSAVRSRGGGSVWRQAADATILLVFGIALAAGVFLASV